jgi:hypothetical protein
MFAQWWGDVQVGLSSFNVWSRGQDAASKAGHLANINVVVRQPTKDGTARPNT